MTKLDTLDSLNEIHRRLEGLAALIGEPATLESAGVSYLLDVLREEAARLRAVTDALDPAVRG